MTRRDRMSPLTQADVSQKILDSMQSLSMDNAEIKTTLKHIDNKFDRVNDDIKDLKDGVLKASSDAEIAKGDARLLDSRVTELEKDKDRLFDKFRERDKKSDADRKWLIGTVIAVFALVISFVSFLITYIV
ncbi:hypothetical protein [Lysinibacillus odysseyi]|uniref:Uncharacterized protein n=1 Tax=Lysinibacillus odysseyi 34hs-1 = NBRC 100172 TaxID=1220589 RepID=A0A0A3IZR3_9BACI|nr:hypothetical protein [Lysinibacillus odysseyi]KGR88393.1 hypothetical protein CD32_01655 [Lysinibacillus odysseyi 34hs-1 = NBRC 100172]